MKTRMIRLLSFAAALLLLSAVPLFVLSSCKRGETEPFDYLQDDLSPYIALDPERYRGHSLALTLDPVSDLDVENALLQSLAKNKNPEPLYEGRYLTARTTAPGDVVYIFYRGYQIDEDGNEIDFYDLTSNFGSEDGASSINGFPEELEVGSGRMISGFELGLIGKNPKDYAKLNLLNRNVVIEDTDVLYVTYSYVSTEDGGRQINNKTARIDLSARNLEEVYGEGFLDTIREKAKVGITFQFDRNLTLGNGEQIRYTSFRVDFIERGEQENPPLIVEGKFPADYSEPTLAGQTLQFAVYIQKTQAYEAPEVNDDFLYETLGADRETFSTYEGDAAARCRAYLRENLETERHELAVEKAQQAMWDFLKGIAEIKDLPQQEVDRIFMQNKNALIDTYRLNYTTMYATLDDFARAYFNLDPGADWESVLLRQVKDEISERLIQYTVMRTENFLPTEEQFQQSFDRVLDKVFQSYATSWRVLRENYETDEDYEAAKADALEELRAYYTDEYFTEGAYYEFAAFRILGLFDVTVNGEPLVIQSED